jgi:hypothetical protein
MLLGNQYLMDESDVRINTYFYPEDIENNCAIYRFQSDWNKIRTVYGNCASGSRNSER